MTKQDIGKINTLTFSWLYHEQEMNRGSDRDYHLKEQSRDERLLMEAIRNIVKNEKQK